MEYLDKSLSNENEQRADFLRGLDHVKLVSKCRKLTQKEIERNSQVHSYRAEHLSEIIPFCVPRNKQKKSVKQGIKNLSRAFEWACSNFDRGNFDESILIGIAKNVTPEIYDDGPAKYRESNVRITGASMTPPYPEKVVNYEIPQFIGTMNNLLNRDGVINSIEAAIYSHLHIVRIHPFYDGNGRTARILQDVILYNSGIPVPVIETGERATYNGLIDKAILDIDEKKALGVKGGATEGEKNFFNYLGGKINASLDKTILGCS